MHLKEGNGLFPIDLDARKSFCRSLVVVVVLVVVVDGSHKVGGHFSIHQWYPLDHCFAVNPEMSSITVK